MLSCDFVVCSTSLNIWSSGVLGLEHNVKLKCSMSPSDYINTIFKRCHASVISENVGNLITFREKFLDLGPKSFCAVKMRCHSTFWNHQCWNTKLERIS